MLNHEKKYTLGLDIGVASIGWAVISVDELNSPKYIVDTGCVVVESMEDKSGNLFNSKRRDKRGSRRTLRRKKHRIERVEKLCEEGLNVTDFSSSSIFKNKSIYDLKVQGLNNELSKDELCRVLLHYAKHRGFKSNRKNETTAEDGKVLKGIKSNTEKLDGRYISEYLVEELDGLKKIKNTKDNYEYSFLRSQYNEEIEKLLETQVNNKVIDCEFAKKYLEIWSSQRDFSEGPGGNSKYAVNFGNVFGVCSFDENRCAPKRSISSEKFTFIQKLQNLRYRSKGSRFYEQKLDLIQINKVLEMAIKKKEIKYKDLITIIAEDVDFQTLKMSKKELIAILHDYKNKNKITENVDFSSEDYIDFLEKKKIDKVFYSLKTYHEFKKVFKKTIGEDKLKLMYENSIEFLDDISVCLTFYKTDERINTYFGGIKTDRVDIVSNLDWHRYVDVINEVVPQLSTNFFKEASSLSLEIIRDLNCLMLTSNNEDSIEDSGFEYSMAMKKLGFDHSIKKVETLNLRKLPVIKTILDEEYKNQVSNPRVIRVLSKCGKLINSCIDKYGMPKNIHIEVARDINLNSSKRSALEDEMLDNMYVNESIKTRIMQEQGMSFHSISKYDIERYKLYIEQNGICPYSQKEIKVGEMLTDKYQVDHILPYSLYKNNSMINKTLVLKSENQDKLDKTPVQYLSGENLNNFIKYINSNSNISDKKKVIYKLKNIEDLDETFKNGAIEDTRFITKYLVDILKNKLDVENVVSHKAGYVNYFKKACRVTNFTHTFDPNRRDNYTKKNNVDFISIVEMIDKKKKKTYEAKCEINGQENCVTIKLNLINKYTPQWRINQNLDFEEFEKIYGSINLNEILSNMPFAKFHDSLTNKSVLSVFEKIEEINFDNATKEQNIEKRFILTKMFSRLNIEILKLVNKKNRENHLHHALDAVCVAALTRSTQKKISDYDKKKSNIIHELNINGHVLLNLSDGQNIKCENIDEYDKCEREYLRNIIPLPFDNFVNEVKAFIYENDMDIKRNLINENLEYRNIRPFISYISKAKRYNLDKANLKVQGLHNEKILGRKGEFTTERISVSELNETKIEKIYDKDHSAKMTYESVKQWIENKKPKDNPPRLPNGREIKKVKLIDGKISSRIYVGDKIGGYAKLSTLCRIDLYKRDGDEKFYFAQRTALDLLKEKDNQEFYLKLWYGQTDNNITLKNEQLKSEFNKITSLHPGDLIDITSNGNSSLCYVVGFSSGLFEIKGIIGDELDIVKKFKKTKNDQMQFTVSTITKIQKRKINIIGEVK